MADGQNFTEVDMSMKEHKNDMDNISLQSELPPLERILPEVFSPSLEVISGVHMLLPGRLRHKKWKLKFRKSSI